jgi:hypothetical protein
MLMSVLACLTGRGAFAPESISAAARAISASSSGSGGRSAMPVSRPNWTGAVHRGPDVREDRLREGGLLLYVGVDARIGAGSALAARNVLYQQIAPELYKRIPYAIG